MNKIYKIFLGLFFIQFFSLSAFSQQTADPNCLIAGECFEVTLDAPVGTVFNVNDGSTDIQAEYYTTDNAGADNFNAVDTDTNGDGITLIKRPQTVRLKNTQTANNILQVLSPQLKGGNFSEFRNNDYRITIEAWGKQPFDLPRFDGLTLTMAATDAPFFADNSATGTGTVSINRMFQQTSITTTGNWNWGSNTSTINLMFDVFVNVSDFDGNISSWDVSNVTNFEGMLEGCTIFNANLSSWAPNSATSMKDMFRNADAFNRNLSSWDVSNVTNFSGMFRGTALFNNGGNSLDWDISNSGNVNMSAMFRDTENFNQPLSQWETSASSTMFRVTNVSDMFYGAQKFNQDISDWNVARVSNFSGMFQNNSFFNNGDDPGVSNTPLDWNLGANANPNLSNMFSNASAFNQDLSSWDVAGVTNFSNILNNASLFQDGQSLLNWDISSATDMSNAFNNTIISLGIYENMLDEWSNLTFSNSFNLGASGLVYCNTIHRDEMAVQGVTFVGDSRLCTPGGVTASVLSLYQSGETPGNRPGAIDNLTGTNNRLSQNSNTLRGAGKNSDGGAFNFNRRIEFNASEGDHYDIENPFNTDGNFSMFIVAGHVPQNGNGTDDFKPIVSTAGDYDKTTGGIQGGFEIALDREAADPTVKFNLPTDDFLNEGTTTITPPSFTNGPAVYGITASYDELASTLTYNVYFNETQLSSLTTTFSDPNNFTNNFTLGGVGFTSEPTNANSRFYNGDIVELATYSETLSDSQANRIKSSLALKYGISIPSFSYESSLGLVYWAADPTYNNRIFGVGKDLGSQLTTNISKSQTTDSSVLTISTTTDFNSDNRTVRDSIINDNSFLMFGDNNLTGATTETLGVVSAETSDRIWKVVDTNNDDCVFMNFDVSGSGYPLNTYSGDYVMLVSKTPLFNSYNAISLSENSTDNYGVGYNFDGTSYVKLARFDNSTIPDYTGDTTTGISTQTDLNFTSTTSPNAYLILNSRSGGLVLPSMTTAERTSLDELPGMIIFNTETNKVEYSDGTADNWIEANPITPINFGTTCN